MYHPAMGRFVSRDPIESERNLYRYVRNGPTGRRDPMGLAADAEKPPFPPAGGSTSQIPNNKFPLGFDLFCRCPPRKLDRITPRIPGIIPILSGFPNGPGGGSAEFFSPPYPEGQTLIGGGGATPCIIVVIKCNDRFAVFHFTPGDEAYGTLGRYKWPSGCEALVWWQRRKRITLHRGTCAPRT